MNQDLKDYFRRTVFIHGGMVIAQILLLCMGSTHILSSIMSILIVEPFVLICYLLIFGIKRKDGTLKRFKKMDEIVKAASNGKY